jgi:tetratricopeptide (TPR) repeat protein
MPARLPLRMRTLAMAASALVFGSAALSQQEPPTRSALDAQLFYQLLIGEIELRGGQGGTAYEVVLDAARKTRDEQLFRHATEIALQARAGEQALVAAKLWHTELPESLEAHRYLVQLLIALNRPQETIEPLQSLLKLTPDAERANLIMSLPRFFSRLQDRQQVAGLLEQVLKPYADAPATRAAVHVALGRAWMIAPDTAKALELARQAQAQDPASEAPVVLALEMLPSTLAAESIVNDYLKTNPQNNSVRMMYARVLANSQRYGDAVTQLEAVTRNDPTLGAAWLTLGALYLELRQSKQATAALERYVQLAQAEPAGPAADPQAGLDEDETTVSADRGLTQAWLMLAQAAEQQNDYKAAEAWLKKVDSPQRALEVLQRRASLTARQGKLRRRAS